MCKHTHARHQDCVFQNAMIFPMFYHRRYHFKKFLIKKIMEYTFIQLEQGCSGGMRSSFAAYQHIKTLDCMYICTFAMKTEHLRLKYLGDYVLGPIIIVVVIICEQRSQKYSANELQE